jgi:hypothetical protein
MADTIEAPPKPARDATDRDEYKRIRAGEKVPSDLTKQKPTQPGDKGSASAAVSETAETNHEETTEAKAQKRDRSLEGRVKELRGQGKHDEADKILREAWTKQERDRADKAEKELLEIRTRKPAEPQPAETRPAAQPQPAAADPSDPTPKQADFDGTEGKTYEDYLVAKARWGMRQDQRQAETAKTQSQAQETIKGKAAEARAKYADFDLVLAGDLRTGTGFIISPAMQDFVRHHPQAFDVLYKLGGNQAEYKRIFALPPALQLAELGVMARDLAAPASGTPPPPNPPASRAAPPPPRPGGTEAPAPKDPKEARTRAEYKRLRAAVKR